MPPLVVVVNKIFMKTKDNKKIFLPLLSIFLGVGIFLLVRPVHAAWAAEVVGGLLGLIIGGLGVILSLVMKVLVMVAQYSDFIKSPAVSNGWKIVRDLCNMFFVLILLIIAFATILQQEKYDYKKWLPKLIMMAVMINFSKTICGLLIDFAQVIMLTFVNAFKGMAVGNLVKNLGLTEIMTLAKESGEVGFFELVTAYLLGLIYVIIALVVITTMLAMLVMRIVMMWIYIVLSPLAYLLAAFPDGKTYSEKWWKQFSENLIVGPVLAFFIWLSFASLQADNFDDQFSNKDELNSNSNTVATQVASDAGVYVSPEDTAFAASKASTPNAFIKFVIAIGMLVGGLKIAQEVGGAAGGIAGQGFSKIKNGASAISNSASKFAKSKAKSAAKAGGKRIGSMTLGATGAMAKGIGNRIQKAAPNSKILKNIGGTMAGTGGVALAWREDLRDGLHKDKEKKRQNFMEKIGMGEKAMGKTDEFLQSDVGKNASNFKKGVLGGAATGAVIGGLPGAIIGGIAGVFGTGLIALAKSRTSSLAKTENEEAEKDENKARDELGKAEVITSSDAYKDGLNNKKTNEEKSVSLGEEINNISQGYDEKISELEIRRKAAIKDKNTTLSTQLEDNINKKTVEKNQAISGKVKEKSKVDAKLKDFSDLDDRAKSHIESAQDLNETAGAHRENASKSLTGSTFFGINGQTWAKIAAFSSKTTQKAAANGSKDIKDARIKVDNLNSDKDAAADFEDGAYYSANGQTGAQNKFFKELTSSSNENSGGAISNLTDWAKNVDPNNDKQMKKVAALARGIAAFSKGGGDTSRLSELISQVDQKNAKNSKPIPSVSSLKDKVIAKRSTGVIGEQGSGDFHVNTYANNDKNEEGKNVIGVDFNKLAGSGLDVKAEASFASGGAMGPIVEALKKQIQDERAKLNELGRTDSISDDDFTKKHNDLDKAEARLNDPNQVKDMQLINTASANYGRQEKMTSKYHEEIHKGGVEDEDLTERTAKSLMDNKLYGRNAATKGRHATEIAKFAQEKKNQGMSNDDIMKEVEKEIKSRLQAEGKNRAERVVKIMSGEKETVSEAIKEETVVGEKSGVEAKSKTTSAEKIEMPEIDTEKFQASLDALSEKFTKTADSFKNIKTSSSGGDQKSTAAIIYALKNIRKAIMFGNTATLKKIGSLSGGEAPGTIIEASVINDALESNNEDTKV